MSLQTKQGYTRDFISLIDELLSVLFFQRNAVGILQCVGGAKRAFICYVMSHSTIKVTMKLKIKLKELVPTMGVNMYRLENVSSFYSSLAVKY